MLILMEIFVGFVLVSYYSLVCTGSEVEILSP
jgi:hypothetical protein